jgi:hypothetical protein
MNNSDHKDNQSGSKKQLRKEVSRSVYDKLAGTMAEFHLEGKRFESKLRKASKLFAAEIMKMQRKKEKSRKHSYSTEVGTAANTFKGNATGTLSMP